jgi:hypothetical protein
LIAASIAAARTSTFVAIVVSAVAAGISATTVGAASVIALIPGTDPDKHAINKVAGPVIAIRRAGIRGILVIAVRADRFRSDIGVIVIVGVTVVGVIVVGVIVVGSVIVIRIRPDVIRTLRRRFCHAEKQDPTQCDVF